MIQEFIYQEISILGKKRTMAQGFGQGRNMWQEAVNVLAGI